MKKKIRTIVITIIACWLLLVIIDGVRLIGSTDPGRRPLLNLGGIQAADKIAEYDSLGFSQTYHLTDGDAFASGEFTVLGLRIAQWG